MDEHETQARMDGQMDEGKNNLATRQAKMDASTGDRKVGNCERVQQRQSQFDDVKICATKAWDVTDDNWGAAGQDPEARWAEREVRAKRVWLDAADKEAIKMTLRSSSAFVPARRLVRREGHVALIPTCRAVVSHSGVAAVYSPLQVPGEGDLALRPNRLGEVAE
jgi:hypothetical protein